MAQLMLLICLLLIQSLISGVDSTSFNLVNKCEFTVWPGILSNAGVDAIDPTGFALQKGDARAIDAPSSWGGRFWGRTFCSTDSDGKFTCATGDCGSGKIECSGSGATPPATLAEFTLSGYGGLDFYDVSLVDGYNLPMLVAPRGAGSGGGQNCSTTGCIVDLNGACPSELKVEARGMSIACKSACEAFQLPQYCCSGAYGSPATCKPTSYSQAFKNACPRAYSYAYDDTTSTFTCGGSPDYTITFCPSPSSSQKASQIPDAEPTTAPPEKPSVPPSRSSVPADSTMIYEGALDVSSASTSTFLHPARSYAFAVSFGVMLALCWTPRLGAFSGPNETR